MIALQQMNIKRQRWRLLITLDNWAISYRHQMVIAEPGSHQSGFIGVSHFSVEFYQPTHLSLSGDWEFAVEALI